MKPPLGTLGGKLLRKYAIWWSLTMAPRCFLNLHRSYNPDAAEWLLMMGCLSLPSSAPFIVDLYQFPSDALWSVGSG